MRTFDDLVREGSAADVSGWGFDWLDGRATEERPPWGYSGLLASRLAHVASAVDIDTGGGEIIEKTPHLAVEDGCHGGMASECRARP